MGALCLGGGFRQRGARRENRRGAVRQAAIPELQGAGMRGRRHRGATPERCEAARALGAVVVRGALGRARVKADGPGWGGEGRQSLKGLERFGAIRAAQRGAGEQRGCTWWQRRGSGTTGAELQARGGAARAPRAGAGDRGPALWSGFWVWTGEATCT